MSPWPSEDGGPARPQVSPVWQGLRPGPGERLAATVRATHLSTMTVLGAPGEIFLLTHNALRARFGLATTAQVERIDPLTLAPLARSPRLAGGPMWPGGMAVHPGGDLHVVYGRHAHRLDRECQVKGRFKLPLALPYNSFVTLANGLIVTKNLSETVEARLTVLDPDTMMRAAPDLPCGEPSIARLSADGDTVYLVGARSVRRYRWGGRCLVEDRDWRFDYLAGTANSFGWDMVLAAGHGWFMDNGRHRYVRSMIGRGVARTANRLLRVALNDASDHAAVPVSGLAGGSITNPPLVDPSRGIVVGYDSANRVLRGWRFDAATGALEGLWRKDGIGCASHMLLDVVAGQIVTNDYGRGGEAVVLLDITTGEQLGRVLIGGLAQGVVFPSIGWGRDLYWCSMSRVARVFVT